MSRMKPDEWDEAERESDIIGGVPVQRPEEFLCCDGCAQLESECLCDVALDQVSDCNSPYHPGCRNCESKGRP